MSAKPQPRARPRPACIKWIPIPQLMERRGIKSRSTIYEMEARGLFPPFVKISPKSAALPDFELDAIDEAMWLGADEDMIRLLVVEQKEMRKACASDVFAPDDDIGGSI